ncbi:MAG: TIGR02266 family protein [Pseudomonadota bacterium]|nr:MAG: TIGR02266 family protein [Pseudomonadota bacterium]
MDRVGVDRRAHPRIPIELRVDYPKLNAFFADYTRNISKGGTFVKTAQPLPVGTRFVFRLSVPTLNEPIVLAGEVAWIREEGDEPGMGIRFVYSSEEARLSIERLVEDLMAKNLGKALSARLLSKP